MRNTKTPSPDRKRPPPGRPGKLDRSVYGVGQGFPPRGSGPGDASGERPAGPAAVEPGHRDPASDTDQREAQE